MRRRHFIATILAVCLLPPWGAAASAASLTIAQLQTLKATIAADPTLAAFPNNADGNIEVANALNVPATPTYWVWRTSLPVAEVYEVTTADGTSWSWPIFIARSQGERDGWRTMAQPGTINPSLPNTRAAVADIFSGAGGLPQRSHFLAIGRRGATRAERVLAGATPNGVGTRGSTANPDTLTFEGNLGYQDVQQARDLP